MQLDLFTQLTKQEVWDRVEDNNFEKCMDKIAALSEEQWNLIHNYKGENHDIHSAA